MNIGIICTGLVESWLFTWIKNRNTDQFTFIKTAHSDDVPDLIRSILKLQNVSASDAIPFCEAYINTTSSTLPESKFDDIRNRIIHVDFLLNNYSSLLLPLTANVSVTSVQLLKTFEKNDYFLADQGHFKTVEHSIEKQLLSITEQTCFLIADFLSKPSPAKEKVTIQASQKIDIKTLYRKVKSARRKHLLQLLFTTYRWNIGITKVSPQQLLNASAPFNISWMKEEKGKSFNADPFLMESNDGVSVYFEHLESGSGKGFICAAHYNKSGFSAYKKVLEKNTHLSYPFTLSYGNKNYILPENSDSGKSILCEVNDSAVISEKDMLDIDAVDPTLFHWNNKWWLFCTRKLNKSADLRLYIYFADAPDGEWKPHQLNPVKCDIRNARPAGNLFKHNDKIYRPSQDSSETYGGRIVINEIKELTEYSFKEEVVASLEPKHFGNKYNGGVHTVSFCNGYMAVDGKRKVFRFRYI